MQWHPFGDKHPTFWPTIFTLPSSSMGFLSAVGNHKFTCGLRTISLLTLLRCF